ncbi:hypothetical protein [Arthrobacter sp. S2(2024)]|uniref:hypothetical protein n=1 Tax=Arthrobacter sp. S2(2024) TaxID=3111911 RepID=UPI002FC58E07
MSAIEAIAQTKAGLRQLRLMIALIEVGPMNQDRQVDIGRLYEEPERWDLERGVIHSDLEALKDRSWIMFWPTIEGIDSVRVDQPGIDAVVEFGELKRDSRRRTQEIRDAILNWLYDLYLSDRHALAISEFLNSWRGNFLGLPYTEGELDRAVQWLRDEEYLDGHGTWGGELLRPNITTRGIRTIETGQSVNKLLTSAGVTVNEVHVQGSQGVNIAVASSNFTQSNTLSQEQIEQVEKILGSVRAMLSPGVLGVTDEVAAQGSVVAVEIEQELQSPTPGAGRVKALLFKLAELAATGTIQGTVDALSMMIHQAMGSM